MKVCSRCKVQKALTEFSKNARARDGLQSRCRPCHSAAVVVAQRKSDAHRKASLKYMLSAKGKASTERQKAKDPEAFRLRALARVKAYQARNKETVRERAAARYAAAKAERDANKPEPVPFVMPTEKTCVRCKVVKPLTEFYKDSNPRNPTGRQYRCKACAVLYVAAHTKANPKMKAERDRRYRKRHPAQEREKWQRYNAKRRNASPKWADKKIMRAIYALARCYTEAGIPAHVDHLVPLRSEVVQGFHCEANLTVMPRDANQKKSNLHWPDMP